MITIEDAVWEHAYKTGQSPMRVLIAVRGNTLRFDGTKIVSPQEMRLVSARAIFDPESLPDSEISEMALIAMARAILDGTLTVCFHCGQMFTSRELCREHFGSSESELVGCQR